MLFFLFEIILKNIQIRKIRAANSTYKHTKHTMDCLIQYV